MTGSAHPHKASLAGLLGEALAGLTTDDAARRAEAFLEQARHPRNDVPYSRIVYQPMRELVRLLDRRDFSVYMVTDSARHAMLVRTITRTASTPTTMRRRCPPPTGAAGPS